MFTVSAPIYQQENEVSKKERWAKETPRRGTEGGAEVSKQIKEQKKELDILITEAKMRKMKARRTKQIESMPMREEQTAIKKSGKYLEHLKIK